MRSNSTEFIFFMSFLISSFSFILSAPKIFGADEKTALNWSLESLKKIEPHHIQESSLDNSQDKTRLKISFEAAKPEEMYPGIYLSFSKEDWSAYNFFSTKIQNPEADPVSLCVGINADGKSPADKNFLAACGSLPAFSEIKLLLPLKPGGSFGLEGILGQYFLPRKWMDSLDSKKIESVYFVLDKPSIPRTLFFKSLTLTNETLALPLTDSFGQFNGVDWPGKIHSLDELREAHEKETISERPSEQDSYGGYAKGPELKATGHFRIEKMGRRWWLVTPTGHLFYSVGVNAVNWSQNTITEGRENLFGWLPDKTDPLHLDQFFGKDSGKQTFNFYLANVKRAYSKNPEKLSFKIVWTKKSLKRLTAWGFNTIGNWSRRETIEEKTLPYVNSFGLLSSDSFKESGVPFFEIGGGHWLPDVFHPQFKKTLLSNTFSESNGFQKLNSDPLCIGLFTDNEIRWTGGGALTEHRLVRALLKENEASYGKGIFIDWLRVKYQNDLSALNKSWETKLAGKNVSDLLSQKLELPSQPNEKLASDLDSLLGLYADEAFRLSKESFKKFLPNKLFLGSRFVKSFTPRPVIEAAAKYVDVLSFNIYTKTLDPKEWAFADKLDKPMLSTEFHFGSVDRGIFQAGLVPVKNQEERGRAYQNYAQSLLKNPLFVGFHWFMYGDEPLTGRSQDGENYNCGLVTVTDLPYPELTHAVSDFNRTIYTRILETALKES